MALHHYAGARALTEEAKRDDQTAESKYARTGKARGAMMVRNIAFERRQQARALLKER